MSSLRVLVVDDEPNIRRTLRACIEAMGCEVREASSASAALETASRYRPEVVFLDVRLGSEDGLALLPKLLEEAPRTDVIMMTAYASYPSAIDAIKRGADNYLPKPFTPAQIRHALEASSERRALARRVEELESLVGAELPAVVLAGSSPAMHEVVETLARAAESDASVLLRGESGTGKGVLARFVHEKSRRSAGRFVTVSCPNLTDALLTAELFGHTRGAFTGAIKDRAGTVEAADGGTLFLDEIGEVSPGLQAKLLRFSQERRFERVGESRTREADVRIVAATNRDLEADVEAGRFRLDLLYRLNVVEVTVPPLRERPDDVLLLARHFLAFFAQSAGRPVPDLSPDAEAALRAHPWPGNVRELRNEMERAIVLGRSRTLGPESLSSRIVSRVRRVPEVGGDFTLDELSREHIERVLARWATQEEAARVLGIDPSTLWRRRKRYGAE